MSVPSHPLRERDCRFATFLCLISLFLPLAEPAWAGLPPGWADADIGSPGLAGSAGYTNGIWTVVGGGTDIWGTSDQFNFASASATGDATLIARVTSLQNSDPGTGWSKAGLMFRNDNTAGSVNVSIVATAGQGVSFQWRSTAGGQSSNSQKTGITVPIWLRLVRSAGTFTGSYSTNGSNWVQVSSQPVTMGSSVLAGLDVTAHNNAAKNTATFTNVSVTQVVVTNPVVTNLPASSVLATSATLNGQLVSPGLSTPSVTIYYGAADGGTNAAAWPDRVSLGETTGNFSAKIAGLAMNTTYYFTALASNSAAVTWAQPSFAFATLATNPFVTPVSVLTYHYDNTRQGANTNETQLVAGNVNTNTFGKLFSFPLDGYVYAQPLLMTNVAIPGQGVRNVLFVATEHDTIYALDADCGPAGTNQGVLWKSTVGSPAISAGAPFGGRYHGGVFYEDINPEVGITGTPVIDAASGTFYVDAFTREISGTVTNFNHRIHALDVTTGQERPYSPVLVAGSVPGTGAGSTNGVQSFSATQEGARAALCLANGILFVAFAGYGDTDPYHGWLFAYQATNLDLKGIFNTTPNAPLSWNSGHGAEGGIWMGGGGICVDANGNIYFETGNGSFTAHTNGVDFGDTLLRLSTTNTGSTNLLAVADYFTPFDQATLEVQDNDLGASGQLLLPDSLGTAAHPHLLIGVGKSGKVYLVDRDNLGHWQSGSDSQIVQSFSSGGGMWSPPVFWNNLLFLQPSGSAMKSFSVSNGYVNPTAVATAPVSFGASQGSPVISANGTNSGIVWVLNNNNGNPGSPGALYALNAMNISQLLWSSQQAAARDSTGPGVKMTTPMVAGGRVYVGGQYMLSVYGVGSFLTAPIIAPAGGLFTNSILVSITNTAPGASVYYTLDGSVPTTNATHFTSPFVITATLAVKAVVFRAGAVPSAVATASFVNSASLGTGTGLTGAYYSNHTSANPFSGSPTLLRTDAVVNFNWGNGSPDPSISSNSFTVRWTGSVQPQFSDTYTFYATTDDGVRLWVNGQLIDDYWMDQGSTTSSGSIALKAQQLYNLTMEYYENSSGASAQLAWGSPSMAQTIIPQTQLYPYTNPPPAVALTGPAADSTYTAAASVTISADADALYDTIERVDFYANSVFVGSVSNVPYAVTATGLEADSYTLTAVAVSSSGLTSTSAPVNITVNHGSGQPYGLTHREAAPAFFNMPPTSIGSFPALLSETGVFSNTPGMVPVGGLIAYTPNAPLWSDNAVKTRFVSIPTDGGAATPLQQIAFAPAGSWTFPAGTVLVKTFQLNTDASNTNVLRRLETRLLVRDANGGVYGVTYKWRPDNSDADLQSSSSYEPIAITNAGGVTTQTWYYPSPSDCLQCHTAVANYVLGLSTRQLNGNQTYAATGVTDNQLRTLNRLGLFNPSFDEDSITNFEALSALGDHTASFEARARSYLDANCAQCHQPGGTGITFDARYDTPLPNQHFTNYPASLSLGFDNARVVASKDVWRSMIWQRMNTTNHAIQMPPLARSLIDSNAVAVINDWINSLPGTPALAPPVLTPSGGTNYGPVTISVLPPDTNATVYYTLDGTLPTTSSLVYSNAILLTNSATVSANAFEDGFNQSVVASGLFTILPAIRFTAPGSFSNGAFQMQLSATPNQSYVLQSSTNLLQWTPISTSTPAASPFDLIDPQATNLQRQFYRVQLQP
jgi:uncharacterized repeat protein (TIGR03806 family)